MWSDTKVNERITECSGRVGVSTVIASGNHIDRGCATGGNRCRFQRTMSARGVSGVDMWNTGSRTGD